MTRLKFRGKHEEKWIYGFGIKQRPDYIYFILDEDENIWYEVESATVEQSTGLLDKNDKEIYEGDIIKVFKSGKWIIGKVIYEHSGFTIDLTNNLKLDYGRASILESLTEVIGNIHDNPELLK